MKRLVIGVSPHLICIARANNEAREAMFPVFPGSIDFVW
jgi:hypothetical protein